MTTRALAHVSQSLPAFDFSAAQRRMIRDMLLSGASDTESAVLIEFARLRRLNPILGQIKFIKCWDGAKQREVWAPIVTIDGLRALAERTGVYDGQDEPEVTLDPEGRIVEARVRVYRKGIDRPFVGVARHAEFVQTKKDGQPNAMWQKMPANQTCKCAEAQALRKAFPEDASGLFIPEEMTPATDRPLPTAGFSGPAENDNARPVDPVGLYTPRLEGATSEKGLRKVASEIAKAQLAPADRETLLDVFQACLCKLRSTPPATAEAPQLPLAPEG